MSINFSCVRLVHAIQFDDVSDKIAMEFGTPQINTYAYLELVSTGWSGARGKSRVKRISLSRALAYVNKLHAGGWISDEVYDLTYYRANELITHWELEGSKVLASLRVCSL